MREQIFQEISQKIEEALRNSPIKDLDKNFKAVLQSVLAKLNIVTREEFEVQQKVLLNTRQKLEELEQKIKELEEKANIK